MHTALTGLSALMEHRSLLCCVQLVQTYTRGMLPGLWPYIWSCVIMKVGADRAQQLAPHLSIKPSGPGRHHTSIHVQRLSPRVGSAASAPQPIAPHTICMAKTAIAAVYLACQSQAGGLCMLALHATGSDDAGSSSAAAQQAAHRLCIGQVAFTGRR